MTDYKQQFRSQFHFSPKEKWMNDPNGLVYNDGIYHLFYQYYPNDIIWGPMHWGHAISKDLMTWEHKPIALFPDKNGCIFSGSAVMDSLNTSELGTKDKPPLVAIFTYHLMKGEKEERNDYQTQGIAYSIDNGDTWIKFNGNPIIENKGIKDFRDPKVFWHDSSNQWVMLLVAGDHVMFYRSNNLKNWTYLSDFGKRIGAHGGVWECPDLFKLKVEGTNEEKWVLIISINPGAPNGGSGTQYFIGDFNGKNFITEHDDIKWVDAGADNYAGITYNNTPNNKRIFIGWMSNWFYGQSIPTKKWRGAMTLPRELSLIKEKGSCFLRSNVIESFNAYVTNELKKDHIGLNEPFYLDSLNFNQTEIKLHIKQLKSLQLEFKNDNYESLILCIDHLKKEISLDRRKSGLINFENRFANKIHTMPFEISNKEVEIRIILDWSSIEIFIDHGKYVMTEQIFPLEYYNALKISSKTSSSIKNFRINHVKSIWKNESL